ncbi:N-acetylneuraminate lyase [Vibrio penaeicida]|uniref:N-acetylneuraminate lyase n=1 Tax=Vibrio penaeicida TaxID=104609 RepID=A0AAV5NWN3_9VIBR|nr:N-acetylneuraminate lyase [Vibrio penaeicida]GLQ74953.1 N-acetylneuraminate lyase [Vibrio penaeicida]
MTKHKPMEGIFIPLMTPFSSIGELEYDKLEGMVEHHISQGVHGFYIGGSSSECFMMSILERQRVLKTVAHIVNNRVPLIAHVGAIALTDVRLLIDTAQNEGYQVISATPPFYYGFTPQEVTYYYQSILDYTDVPLLLYNIPGTTGVTFTHQTLLNLSAMDNVIGIKHTTHDMFFIERLRQLQPNSLIFHGEDSMLVNGLQMGASGGIGTTYNLMAAKYVAIFEAMKQGDTEKAMDLQHQVNRVTEVLLEAGLYQSIKFAMGELGIDYGQCREPFLPLSKSHKTRVMECLTRSY